MCSSPWPCWWRFWASSTADRFDHGPAAGARRAAGRWRAAWEIRHTIWIEAAASAASALILGVGLGAVNLYYQFQIVRRRFGGMRWITVPLRNRDAVGARDSGGSVCRRAISGRMRRAGRWWRRSNMNNGRQSRPVSPSPLACVVLIAIGSDSGRAGRAPDRRGVTAARRDPIRSNTTACWR